VTDTKHPLHSVPLVKQKATGEGPQASAAAVAGFQQQVQQNAASVAEQQNAGMETEEGAQEVPQPGLSEQELAAALQFRALVDMNGMDATNLAEHAHDLKMQHERNRQIEGRLKKLRLSDLLLRDYLSQEIPIAVSSGTPGAADYDPGFSVTFRTISAELELDCGEIARDICEEWPKEGGTAPTQTFVLQVATLVCGLTHIDTAAQVADELHTIADVKMRREALAAHTRKFLQKPIPLLNELFSHQRMFIARVRKVLSHAGYMEHAVGNS
jgi:hypothetical protein